MGTSEPAATETAALTCEQCNCAPAACLFVGDLPVLGRIKRLLCAPHGRQNLSDANKQNWPGWLFGLAPETAELEHQR